MERQRERWYVVQAQPRKERLAETHLQNQGFPTFLPLSRKTALTSAHRGSVCFPFFPSYLFVSLDIGRDRWRAVNGTIGVSRLVSFGRDGSAVPSPLPDGLVECLLQASTATGEVRFEERFSPGDAVRIIGGPFDALCGVLEASKGTDRMTILLDILSQRTRVEVKREFLVPA